TGVTRVYDPLPVDKNNVFNIGSTSKTFTATALMILAERGALSLDDRVQKFLPDFKLADPEAARNVTIRHLVTHTGGWDGDVSIGVDQGWGDDALAGAVALLEESEQQAPLGEIWAYNNSGFQTSGRIIEVITGKPFEE